MKRRGEFGYTLVQHSGFGYAGKPGFQQALEIRCISSRAELNRVMRVGGVVCNDYGAADEMAEKLNYPHEFKTPMDIYPAFQGTFSKAVIDGLRIAIPAREVVLPEHDSA